MMSQSQPSEMSVRCLDMTVILTTHGEMGNHQSKCQNAKEFTVVSGKQNIVAFRRKVGKDV